MPIEKRFGIESNQIAILYWLLLEICNANGMVLIFFPIYVFITWQWCEYWNYIDLRQFEFKGEIIALWFLFLLEHTKCTYLAIVCLSVHFYFILYIISENWNCVINYSDIRIMNRIKLTSTCVSVSQPHQTKQILVEMKNNNGRGNIIQRNVKFICQFIR